MQTFLPYPSFTETARCLDYRRLGKQRVETFQILQVLSGEKAGWRNHPAVKMWTGHSAALAEYGLAICDEWIRRGYKDTLRERIRQYRDPDVLPNLPSWVGKADFHLSHQSNLVRKYPEHYQPLFPGVPDHLEYVWPVTDAVRMHEDPGLNPAALPRVTG